VQSAANDSRRKFACYLEEKDKIERKNRGRSQFFQTSPGFKRGGQVLLSLGNRLKTGS
jgi:hypothetical protein